MDNTNVLWNILLLKFLLLGSLHIYICTYTDIKKHM